MKRGQVFPLLRMVMLALSCLYANSTAALGLGELTLRSALNEQLKAEIELVNVGDAEQHHILVGLASKQEFAAAGVPWEYYLTRLQFKTDLSNPARPVIRVSTEQVIKEPYLDFVVQLHWPAGKLLREYTVFLDLPVFDPDTQPKPLAAPVVSSTAQKPSVSESQSAAPAPAPVQQVSPPPASPTKQAQASVAKSGSQYRVRAGDTLWHIAKRLSMSETNVYQRMSAIHQENPSAFVNGDMNLLLKGAVLRIPDAGAVKGMDANQAFSQVKGHTLASVPKATTPPSAMTETAGDVDPEYPPPLPENNDAAGVLKLSVAGEDPGDGGSGHGDTSGAGGTGEKKAGDLLSAREELDKVQRENLELKSKLSNLEQQLETMSRLLELESDELRAAQLATEGALDQQKDVPGDQTAVQATPAEPVDSDQALAPDGQVVDSDEELAEAAGEPTGTDSREAVDQGLSGEDSGSLSAFLSANALPLGGLGVVALIIVFLFSRSRANKNSTASAEQVAPDLPAHVEESTAAGADSAAEIPEPVAEAGPEAALPDEIPGEEIAVSVQTEGEGEELDPLSEADIYLSMDDFAKAEQVVEQALGFVPENVDLHLKRLEIISAQEDLERFDTYYPALVALGDRDAITRADRMRGYLPGADAVAAGEPAEEEIDNSLEAQVARELGVGSIDLGTAEPEAESEETLELDQLDMALDEGELEFDLSDTDLEALTDADSSELEPAQGAAVGESEPEQSLELDTVLDELAAEVDEATAAFDDDQVLESLSLDDGELDLSEIELDLPSSADALTGSGDEQGDGEALLESEDTLFEGIELPDEFSELESDTAAQDVVLPADSDEVAAGDSPVVESGDIADIEIDTAADAESEEELAFDLGSLEFGADDELEGDELSQASGTQLELARAYIEMGDEAGARDLLAEVIAEGSETHKSEANELLAKLSG